MGAPTILQTAQAAPVEQRKKHKTDNLPRALLESVRLTQKTPFNAIRHLSFTQPKRISTFADIDQPSTGISEHAFSDPFPLFTQEAIEQMRAEVFSDDVLSNHYCPTSETSGQIRGHCPRSVSSKMSTTLCILIFYKQESLIHLQRLEQPRGSRDHLRGRWC